MTMFDHDGGRGVKISENLTTWYMDAPEREGLLPHFLKNLEVFESSSSCDRVLMQKNNVNM